MPSILEILDRAGRSAEYRNGKFRVRSRSEGEMRKMLPRSVLRLSVAKPDRVHFGADGVLEFDREFGDRQRSVGLNRGHDFLAGR